MKLRLLELLCAIWVSVTLPAGAQTPHRSPNASLDSSKPSKALRTSGGYSDLQGVWSFAVLTPLERPSDLASKSSLTDQEAAEFARNAIAQNNRDRRDGGSAADVARAYNDLFYDFGTRASRQASLIVDPPDGKLPPMTPEGKAREAAYTAMYDNSSPAGPEERPLWERCIVGFNSGPPMLPRAYNNNVQVFQTRETVALLNEMVHSVRIIPLDGRPHGTLRRWTGDSRGHWEGDTLVVETINFMPEGIGNAALRGRSDENLHLTERFKRKDAETLLYQFTVDDPTIWTRPWTAVVPMTKAEGYIYEYACHEGNYGMFGILKGSRAEEAAAVNHK